MNDARKAMMNDYGRTIAGEIEDLMQRRVDLAMHVFSGKEIAEIVLKVATSVSLAAVTVVVQQKRDDIDAGDLFDRVVQSLHGDLVAKKRHLSAVLAQVEEFHRTGQRV